MAVWPWPLADVWPDKLVASFPKGRIVGDVCSVGWPLADVWPGKLVASFRKGRIVGDVCSVGWSSPLSLVGFGMGSWSPVCSWPEKREASSAGG